MSPTVTYTPRPTRTPPINAADVGRVDRDVTFCTADGVALKLDLYYPLKVTSRPAPILVNVHGGSWSGGDKRSSETLEDVPELLARGYLVAAVNYRLAPKYRFPAQIEDLKCAIRFLRQNAATFNLDPAHVGTWGCSAGGHLAALLGLTNPRDGFDGSGEYANESSRVQAVVTISGPTDFSLAHYNDGSRADTLARVFGTTSITDTRITRASPVNYVSKRAPPFFILGGDQDNVVPLAHAEELYRRLKDAGADVSLLVVKNGHHCLPPALPPLEPSRKQVTN
ncbi:MAG: alpha/beta hydrolase, partial [Chloroflexota bacterium]|nr:alpha/beta hydrolase [Chloroflexota bacterium]